MPGWKRAFRSHNRSSNQADGMQPRRVCHPSFIKRETAPHALESVPSLTD
jgi:hypothetical protein